MEAGCSIRWAAAIPGHFSALVGMGWYNPGVATYRQLADHRGEVFRWSSNNPLATYASQQNRLLISFCHAMVMPSGICSPWQTWVARYCLCSSLTAILAAWCTGVFNLWRHVTSNPVRDYSDRLQTLLNLILGGCFGHIKKTYPFIHGYLMIRVLSPISVYIIYTHIYIYIYI